MTNPDTDPNTGRTEPMDNRNIFAYTAPGSNVPEYISINRRNDELYVSVRTAGGSVTSEMRLPYTELDKLIKALRGAQPLNLYGSGTKKRPAP